MLDEPEANKRITNKIYNKEKLVPTKAQIFPAFKLLYDVFLYFEGFALYILIALLLKTKAITPVVKPIIT